MDESDPSQQIRQACTACGTLLDVSDELPFAQIYCPICGQGLRARTQFNNFTLQEILGEGGMGSVFKAVDMNLQRLVALKILKKECSVNAEERERLETEARITASINHPHVVKVFSFGDDHGQFYLAMELVEKGSLDDLMAIQRRVAEAQVLEVGIQIAQGLEAAWERGLIHRDVKPGNILFADAHTAKIVDFGLALPISDEEEARGEVWGTPYYIAPEKLNNEPEDFRSDMYSLGGTLFHALAGRPPFEAQNASLVALKHIKSHAVSLQAFAPDISSETAYVINRTLNKNPDERYPSYAEFVEHLSYARAKLLERAAKPRQPKQRVVVESTEQQTFMGLVTIGILLLFIISGILLFVFRDHFFGEKNATGVLTIAQINQKMTFAKSELFTNKPDKAFEDFQKLTNAQGIPQPVLNWIRLNEALAALVTNQPAVAKDIFALLRDSGLYSYESENELLANFFVNVSERMVQNRPVSEAVLASSSKENFETFGILLYGIKNLELGEFASAKIFLTAFLQASPKPPYDWIADYKPFAQRYLDDCTLYLDLSARLGSIHDPAAAGNLLREVKAAQAKVRTEGAIKEKFDDLIQDLQMRGAKP